MVLEKTYPTLIKQALNTYVSLVNGSPSPHVDVVCVSSDQHQQYVVRLLCWREGRRMSTSVLHVALRDHKIWTSEDWTEDGIATTFLKDGVPSEDMVLGWKPPMMLIFPSLPSHNVLITTRKKRANLFIRLALFFSCSRTSHRTHVRWLSLLLKSTDFGLALIKMRQLHPTLLGNHPCSNRVHGKGRFLAGSKW